MNLFYRFRFICVIFFSLLLSSAALTPLEASSGSKHEFRSVWLTTAWGLDWPKSFNAATQQSDMIAILNQLKNQNMNAVVFQVSPRGDAYYQSDRLPWAYYLTGTPGQDPGWDPLQFVIDEARKRGMEVHAWYNPFATAYNSSNDNSGPPGPPNVRFTNPDWMEHDGWMNPGIPAAREWQVANVMELIENYDIDAIHFDRIRYDSFGYNRDADLMALYNPDNISGLDNWRRHNINEFVREVYEGVQQIKPDLKIGVTPMGHYDERSSDGWGAMYSYSEVFQDSRYWAQQGYVDYIAPQIYWDLGTQEPPRFAFIANEWVENRKNNRHLYIGIGAYKQIIRNELPQQIDAVRNAGAEGMLYYRNDDISWTQFSGRYSNPALVPAMPWRDMNEPDSVRNLSVQVSGQNFVLTWDEPLSGNDTPEAYRYVVYRADAVNILNNQGILDNPENIIAVTGERTISDAFAGSPESVVRTYYVTALSRNNVEGEFRKIEIGEGDPVTQGILRGVIYQGEDINDPASRIAGATVSLNTGQQMTSGEDGAYLFELEPGEYTVTATKAGYEEGSLVREVEAGETSWGSIQLIPSAGPGPDAMIPYNQNFGSGASLPVYWTRENISGASAANWVTKNTSDTGFATFSSSNFSDGYAFIESESGRNVHARLITPVLDASNREEISLKFEHHYKYQFGNSARIMMRVNGGSWQQIASYTTSSRGSSTNNPSPPYNVTSTVIEEIPITEANPGTLQFAFEYNDNNVWDWYWYLDNVEVHGEVVVSAEKEASHAEHLKLKQNYPNPFNPVTVIDYHLPGESDVRLEVFDMLGRKVALLAEGTKAGGQHSVSFDASSLASGIYVYRLQAGNETIVRRMSLAK